MASCYASQRCFLLPPMVWTLHSFNFLWRVGLGHRPACLWPGAGEGGGTAPDRAGGASCQRGARALQVQQERDDLYRKFTTAILEVQQKAGFRNLVLERKVQALVAAVEKKEVQLNEVLAASNLDPTALTLVSRKLEVGLEGCAWGSVPPGQTLSQPWGGVVAVSWPERSGLCAPWTPSSSVFKVSPAPPWPSSPPSLRPLPAPAEAIVAISLDTELCWKRPRRARGRPVVACAAGGGKASLGGMPEHRLSVCPLERLQLSVAFPWGGLSWAPGTTGKGQTGPPCPWARGPDCTCQGPRPELGLDLLLPDLGYVTERAGDMDRGLWCCQGGVAWLWGPARPEVRSPRGLGGGHTPGSHCEAFPR